MADLDCLAVATMDEFDPLGAEVDHEAALCSVECGVVRGDAVRPGDISTVAVTSSGYSTSARTWSGTSAAMGPRVRGARQGRGGSRGDGLRLAEPAGHRLGQDAEGHHVLAACRSLPSPEVAGVRRPARVPGDLDVADTPDRAVRNSPMIVALAQAENVAGTTYAMRSGWARAARTIARASSAVAAIRASVRTCLPASSAAIVTGAWRTGHARRGRRRRPGRRPAPATRVRAGKTQFLGHRRADSSERFATPTSSMPSIARKRGTCSAATIRPAPTSRPGGLRQRRSPPHSARSSPAAAIARRRRS